MTHHVYIVVKPMPEPKLMDKYYWRLASDRLYSSPDEARADFKGTIPPHCEIHALDLHATKMCWGNDTNHNIIFKGNPEYA